MKKIIMFGICLSIMMFTLMGCANNPTVKPSAAIDLLNNDPFNDEAIIDSDYISDLQKGIEPYKHLGVSIDNTAGLMMYEEYPVREIRDNVAGIIVTESMGEGFGGRDISRAVDLTVEYENGKPVQFHVSTQEEFDKRTEERLKDVNLEIEETK